MDTKYDNDAWKKFADFHNEHTAKFELREDLSVSAVAYKRHITLEVGGCYRHTNIGTAREYAKLILDACDFIDEQNPGWASNHTDLDEYLGEFDS